MSGQYFLIAVLLGSLLRNPWYWAYACSTGLAYFSSMVTWPPPVVLWNIPWIVSLCWLVTLLGISGRLGIRLRSLSWRISKADKTTVVRTG